MTINHKVRFIAGRVAFGGNLYAAPVITNGGLLFRRAIALSMGVS
jgi:hypothetical protein